MDKHKEFERAILAACNLLDQEVVMLQVTIKKDTAPAITVIMEAPYTSGAVH